MLIRAPVLRIRLNGRVIPGAHFDQRFPANFAIIPIYDGPGAYVRLVLDPKSGSAVWLHGHSRRVAPPRFSFDTLWSDGHGSVHGSGGVLNAPDILDPERPAYFRVDFPILWPHGYEDADFGPLLALGHEELC